MNDIKTIVNDIIDGNQSEVMKRLRALYFTLREMKGHSYRAEDYKWVLGVAVLNELKLQDMYKLINANEPMFLFDIIVDKDWGNPYNVQIFEDITNKIYIEREADNDTSTKES